SWPWWSATASVGARGSPRLSRKAGAEGHTDVSSSCTRGGSATAVPSRVRARLKHGGARRPAPPCREGRGLGSARGSRLRERALEHLVEANGIERLRHHLVEEVLRLGPQLARR